MQLHGQPSSALTSPHTQFPLLAATAKKASPAKKPSPAKKAASPPKAAASSAGKKASPPKAAAAAAASSSQQQKERLTGGKELVGQRVKVYWDGDEAWYKGEVVEFNDEDKKHKGEWRRRVAVEEGADRGERGM